VTLLVNAPPLICKTRCARFARGMPPSVLDFKSHCTTLFSQDFNISSRNLTDGVGRLRYIPSRQVDDPRTRIGNACDAKRCRVGACNTSGRCWARKENTPWARHQTTSKRASIKTVETLKQATDKVADKIKDTTRHTGAKIQEAGQEEENTCILAEACLASSCSSCSFC
jgi:hypothetical protein